jgi:hypothetical protein
MLPFAEAVKQDSTMSFDFCWSQSYGDGGCNSLVAEVKLWLIK